MTRTDIIQALRESPEKLEAWFREDPVPQRLAAAYAIAHREFFDAWDEEDWYWSEPKKMVQAKKITKRWDDIERMLRDEILARVRTNSPAEDAAVQDELVALFMQRNGYVLDINVWIPTDPAQREWME